MRRLVDMIGLRHCETEKPSVPKDCAVFAIGDIHGRLDLLADLQQQIITLAAQLPATRKTIVYLGNYIDYGPDGADVIDTLLSIYIAGFRPVYLMGEAEHHFINFLKGKIDSAICAWLFERGGMQTLKSYGVKINSSSMAGLHKMRVELLRKIPTDHLTFLENLQLSYTLGDYFFVHAGIDPKVPLKQQKPSDLLTITDSFLNHAQALDKIIVHGHTAFETPCIRSNRIGLNTAAHNTNILSGVIITADKFNPHTVACFFLINTRLSMMITALRSIHS